MVKVVEISKFTGLVVVECRLYRRFRSDGFRIRVAASNLDAVLCMTLGFTSAEPVNADGQHEARRTRCSVNILHNQEHRSCSGIGGNTSHERARRIDMQQRYDRIHTTYARGHCVQSAIN